MSKRYLYLLIMVVFAALSAVAAAYALFGRTVSIEQYSLVDRVPRIHPDYCGTVIPPNIAPLNFLVQEKGTQYCVKIHSKHSRPIEVFSRNAKIIIPQKPWHELLNENRGRELYFDVFVKSKNGRWSLFSAITNKIASEPVDGYLVYRKIHPLLSDWQQMSIYQRDLRNYDDTPVLRGSSKYIRACLNCHSFCANRPDKMLISIRGPMYGSNTVLVDKGKVYKIGTKFGYASWHPSGRLAVYSLNKVRQIYHSARNEVREVVDLDSLLAYYMVGSKTVRTVPQLSRKDRLETYPCWSPDGRYLYFCSAPMLWTDPDKLPTEHYDQVKYDLMRIGYDIDSDAWGELETVLSAEDTALSILEPRVSPDGRWLSFCMCNYGCFPIHQQSSDLYMIDLKAAEQTGRYEYRRLDELDSDQSESWHSFSSNSRWIAFSSKKGNGKFTRVYIGYVDKSGKVYKPFVMPWKDPTYYDSCLLTNTIPEFLIEPVGVTEKKLGRVIRSSREIEVDMPITMATPTAGGAPGYEERE